VLPSIKQKADELHLGLSWNEGSGKFKLTKIVTLTPRFFIKNMLQEAIVFREHGNVPRDRQVLKPGERQAFMALRKSAEKLLTLAFPGLNAQWYSWICRLVQHRYTKSLSQVSSNQY